MPVSAQPSLEELRRMFDARARVRELERKQLSRVGSIVLIVVLLVLAAIVLIWPDRAQVASPASESDLAAKSAEIQRQLSNPEAGTADAHSNQGDLNFAMDLMRFIQPGAPRTKSSDPTPAQ